MTFEEDVLAAGAVTRDTADVDVMVGGKLRTLRFTQLPGTEWGWLCAINPVRLEVPLDKQYGYNFHAVVHAAAKLNGVLANDDGDEAVSAETWDALFAQLSGNEYTRLADAIWGLNEWGPGLAVSKAKKALALKSKVKPG
jgi:hypothetical protein